ncbi:MAG: hypothetical protein ABMA64_03010 [Myxococcota bacterium]
MVWWLVGVAAAAPQAIVAIRVTAPDGTVAMQDEVLLPSERILPSPDGKYAVGMYVATFEEKRAVVELVAGPSKDGKPKTKVAKSFELDLYAQQDQPLIYKRDTWIVSVKLGEAWDAPAAVEVQDPERYVLVWDDAPMIADPLDKKAVPLVERTLASGRTDALTQASPMKVVETGEGSQLKVETVPLATPSHCQVGGPPIDTFPVQTFVTLKELVPRVTAREVAAKLPDGTGYRVAAGVPVVQEGEGTWRVSTGGLSFLIQATADDIAFYYRPSAHFTTLSDATVRIKPGVVGKTALGEVSWAGPEPLVVAGIRGAAAPLITLQVPCAEVRVAPDMAALVR